MAFKQSHKKGKTEKFHLSGLTKAMEIPEDFVRGNPLVSIEGQKRVVIENFKGISSYTEEEVRLITKGKKICISGKRLKIEDYTKEEITITGLIEKIEFI